MVQFIDALRLPDKAVREAILDDLCEYFKCSQEDAIYRATNWGAFGLAEWNSAGDVETYARDTISSVYSLLWYSYLQAEGLYVPLAAGVARVVGRHGDSHLDFGSGVGVTSQLFRSLGYSITLADVAVHLLDFARFRLSRRQIAATYLDLNEASLDEEAYDVVTALDVLSLIPDLEGTAKALHRSLKPNGLLFANFPTGVANRNAPWHLYDDDRQARRLLQRIGFEPVRLIDKNAGILYRKVNPRDPAHVLRGVRDAVQFGPPRNWYRAARRRLSGYR